MRVETARRTGAGPVTGGMVTANHYLAAEAGARMLAADGNAIDAAVATAFAAGVVEPAMSGIGGRGYLVAHFPDGASIAIDGHERAPLAATADMFEVVDDAARPTLGWGPQYRVVDDANTTGLRAVAVPGVLAALCYAHGRYGRLPLGDVIAPAIEFAERGIEVTPLLAATIAGQQEKLTRFEATRAVFMPTGRVPEAGDILVQRDLAGSLRSIATHGPSVFYGGWIAEAIEAEMQRGGGIMSRRDLAKYRPRIWDRPLTSDYRGYQLLTMPEATGGITLVQIMNLLEGFDVTAQDPHGVPYLHMLLEAMRVAFQDRLTHLDDPESSPVPLAGLASRSFAIERREAIALDRTANQFHPGDPWPHDEYGPSPPGSTLAAPAWHERDTTHFCAVDRDGMVVSMTQSIIDAFGSGVVVPGTGILLNSAMHNFTPVPGRRGSIAPWRRSMHFGTPAIVLDRDGQAFLALGGAGGSRIVSGAVQVLVNVLDRDWPVQEAVAAPRVHNEGWDSEIADGIDDGVVARLRGMGHALEVVKPRPGYPVFGRMNAIAIDGSGRLTGGCEPFSDGGAAWPTE